MNIQTLKIHNIASIENAQIDFNKSPLANEPIFLITGETGSGKTTILNAICLALYNQVPCLKRIGTAEVDKEGLQTNNPRQLLRRGTGEGEIELTFIGNDGKHYTASWRVQRARKRFDGNYQDIVRQLYIQEEGITLTRKSEIENQILLAIGLTFEQFTRTTMLAQGQFANFMMANDNEKSEILEKLTGTEIYAHIGQRINALMQDKVKEYNALDNQIKGVTLLKDDEKEAMSQKMTDLSAQIQTYDTILKTLDNQLQWLQKEKELKTLCNEKALEQEQAEAATNSDNNKRMKATVSEWEMTATIRSLINQNIQENQELTKAQQELKALEQTYLKIANGLEWQKKQWETTVAQKAEVEKKLKDDAKHEGMYAHAEQIKMLAKNVADFTNEQQKQSKEKARIEDETKQCQQQLKKLQSAFDDASDKFKVQDNVVGELRKSMETMDLSKLTHRVNELNSIISRIKQWQQAQSDWREAHRLLQEARGEQVRLQTDLDKHSEELPALELNYAQKHGRLEGLMSLNDHIRELRQRFEEQETCPLCGSKMTHLHNDEVLNNQLSVAKEQDAEAKKILDETRQSIASIKAELKSLGATLLSREADTTKKQEKMTAAEKEVSTYPDYAASDVIDKLSVQLQEAQQALDEASKTQNNLNLASSTLETLRKMMENAEKELIDENQKAIKLEQQAKTVAGLITNATAQIEKNMRDLLGLVTEGIQVQVDKVLIISNYIEQRANQYSCNKNELQRLANLQESQNQQLTSNQKAFSGIKDHFKVQALLVPAELPNLDDAINALTAKIHAIEGAMQQTQVKINELQSGIDSYFVQPDSVSREQVEMLNRLTADTINDYKQQTEGLDKRLADAKATVKTITEQMESHNLTRPPMEDGVTPETLTEARDAKAKEREAANNDLVSLRTQLENDQVLVDSLSEKYCQLGILRIEKNDWETLDKTFGGVDGKKFRNIAQSYVLRALLSKANYYMNLLSSRYTLDCEDGSLTINVIDKHQGNAIRNVGLLSGGEGFIASLALALGLSSISNSKLNVDTLFIDEGFGTLSGDYLETVINTLDRLHQLGGRRVGIISHVEGLKERIPTQICLQSSGPSSSEVKVVSR